MPSLCHFGYNNKKINIYFNKFITKKFLLKKYIKSTIGNRVVFRSVFDILYRVTISGVSM